MALFGLKKTKEEKKDAVKPVKAVKAPKAAKPAKAEKVSKTSIVASVDAGSAASVIIQPRVTEKSGILAQGGVYTFEVIKSANKEQVFKAITALYKITPVKIAMINTPMRNVFVKGRKGTVAGIRKAIVTVKKGEKIDFI